MLCRDAVATTSPQIARIPSVLAGTEKTGDGAVAPSGGPPVSRFRGAGGGGASSASEDFGAGGFGAAAAGAGGAADPP